MFPALSFRVGGGRNSEFDFLEVSSKAFKTVRRVSIENEEILITTIQLT